ncbi:NAD(P)H-binding protein [Flavobacterium sp.]|uniref:NmrA family NAD(P)-binding protein n=1 Tax=Flavobacterium sp. TaxID=239 RepID=UPI002BBD9DF7|nr:NAD(P)H-binding protein [Flavobacterium sp.]HSD05888.1 NAD(P)H-binding protein [Flavobacterium sp.]
MKIVVTGSLGRIGKPLTEELLQKGHSVIVISSKAEKQNEIEALGATAAIGSILDANFLTATFKGADIVYLMEPPFDFFDQSMDTKNYWENIANSYVKAIQQSGVTKVVHLSSIGAHTDQGVGMLEAHHFVENILKKLPDSVSIKTMRPVGFYYNMFAFIPTIKNAGAIIQNYGGDDKEPWVSPLDIASAIVEEIEKPFIGRTIRYIASDEVSPNEIAKILGEAIGKLDLKWIEIPDEEFQKNLINIGFNPIAAKGLTEMNASRRYKLYDDYNQNKPVLGEIKVVDFAKDFAKAYHN